MKKKLLNILITLLFITLSIGVFIFYDALHIHYYTAVKYSATEHQYICRCGDVKNVEPHIYSADYVSNNNGTKSIICKCGQVYDTIIDESAIIVEDNVVLGLTDYGKELDEIVILEGITGIGESAFYGRSLYNITIPNSVTSIGKEAFANFTLSYQNYKQKNNLYYIGNEQNPYLILVDTDWALRDKSITIESGCRFIVDSVFFNNNQIVDVVVPDSVTSIDWGAFWGCSSLENVKIGSGVKSIDKYAFWNCFSLKNIEIAEDNEYYKDIDGNLYSKDGTTLIQYVASKNDVLFVIPNGVTTICDYAFYNCRSLKSVVIPDSVTSIGVYAFAYCGSLASVIIPKSVTNVGAGVFLWCRLLTVYCEVESEPSDWDKDWNSSNCSVVWGYKGKS